MRMRPEFDYIRKYNSDKLKNIVESYQCNKRIKSNLEKLEYYKTVKPAEGLNDFHQIIIRQVIINRMIELNKEIERLRIRVCCLATKQSLEELYGRSHITQY